MLAALRSLQGGAPLAAQALRAAPTLVQACSAWKTAAAAADSSSSSPLQQRWDPRLPLPPPPAAAACKGGGARAYASRAAWQQRHCLLHSSAAAGAPWRQGAQLDGGSSTGSSSSGGDGGAAAATDPASWENDPADCDICESGPKTLDAEATAALKQQLREGRARGGGVGDARPTPSAAPSEQARRECRAARKGVGAASAVCYSLVAYGAGGAVGTTTGARAAAGEGCLRRRLLAAVPARLPRRSRSHPPIAHSPRFSFGRCSRRTRTTWAVR